MDDLWKALTFVLGLLLAWLAVQQWWIAREKLRLDLFGRRYAVFECARTFVSTIMRDGKVDLIEQKKLWSGTIEALFLFGPEVESYLALLNKKAAELHAFAQTGNYEAELERMSWMAEQLRDLGMPKVFAPYLKFQDLEGPLSTVVRRVTLWVASKRAKPEKYDANSCRGAVAGQTTVSGRRLARAPSPSTGLHACISDTWGASIPGPGPRTLAGPALPGHRWLRVSARNAPFRPILQGKLEGAATRVAAQSRSASRATRCVRSRPIPMAGLIHSSE